LPACFGSRSGYCLTWFRRLHHLTPLHRTLPFTPPPHLCALPLPSHATHTTPDPRSAVPPFPHTFSHLGCTLSPPARAVALFAHCLLGSLVYTVHCTDPTPRYPLTITRSGSPAPLYSFGSRFTSLPSPHLLSAYTTLLPHTSFIHTVLSPAFSLLHVRISALGFSPYKFSRLVHTLVCCSHSLYVRSGYAILHCLQVCIFWFTFTSHHRTTLFLLSFVRSFGHHVSPRSFRLRSTVSRLLPLFTF